MNTIVVHTTQTDKPIDYDFIVKQVQEECGNDWQEIVVIKEDKE